MKSWLSKRGGARMFRSAFVIVVGCCSLEASLPYKETGASTSWVRSHAGRISSREVDAVLDPELEQAVKAISPLVTDKTRLLEFGKRFVRFAKQFDQSMNHEVKTSPIQILQELGESGASDEFLFSFMDLFLRMAGLVGDPLGISYDIAFPLIPLGASEPLSRGIPYIPVISDTICKNGSFAEKVPAVLRVFDACRSFSEERADPQLFKWALELMSRALPYVSDPEQMDLILDCSARILDLLSKRNCSRDFRCCIPSAIENNVVRTGSLEDSLEDVVELLAGNLEVLVQMMGLSPGFPLPKSSCILAVALLSKPREVFLLVPDFFRFLSKRLNEIVGYAPLFENFVESIINSLIVRLPAVDGAVNAGYLLVVAQELLIDWLVPDELENDEKKDCISNLLSCVQDESVEPEQKDHDVAEFFDDIFAEGRASVPLSAYEVLAELLLWICNNPALYPCSIDALAQNYEFLSPLPFRQKAAFVGAIGHQLRYLYQFLSNHVFPDFKPTGSPLDDRK